MNDADWLHSEAPGGSMPVTQFAQTQTHLPQVDANYDAYNALSVPPVMMESGFRFSGNTAAAAPKVDLVQALVQLAYSQERIAWMELEKTKIQNYVR
jgi:hypothetical protein